MAFTAADVKKLREMTSVGMMDCKKAPPEQLPEDSFLPLVPGSDGKPETAAARDNQRRAKPSVAHSAALSARKDLSCRKIRSVWNTPLSASGR